jgi:D-3-phosphoglycerate dehydrogenase / 2-oxoglutarate reductase
LGIKVTINVLVADKIFDEGIRLLEEKGYQVKCVWDLPKAELSHLIADYDVLIVRSATKVKGLLLDNAKKLRVIGRAGEGLDNVDYERVQALGISLVNTPHVSYLSVAELTMGHLLALARNIVQGTTSLRNRNWEKEKLIGHELNGKSLGIIGCGYIGETVERLAKAFGMNVLPVEECACDRFVPLGKMLPQADFITIHVPLTSYTKHMISTREFNLMKKGVMLIDCSRGGVVDQEALYQALISGKVAGAALDVFEDEPPKNNKLLTLDKVIATPHIGAQTYEAQLKASLQIAMAVINAIEKPVS